MHRSIKAAIGCFVTLFSAHALGALSVFATVPEWGALAQEIGGDKVDVYTATNALQEVPGLRANRCRWADRARSTRERIAAEVSPLPLAASSPSATAPTMTCMSIRSASGPEMRALYRSTSTALHAHDPAGSAALPHGQGLDAPTSVKRAG